MAKQYWLMKSEPFVFSIDDLKRDKVTPWEGVRNYQARNFMRDDMQVGDLALFYHSNAKPSGIAGVCKICHKAHPDKTALNPKSEYYDPKASEENPIWMMVDVEFVEKFPHFISLEELHATKGLESMRVLQKGSRLSIQPVTPEQFQKILLLGRNKK